MWLRYPRFKSDLNAAHVQQFAEETGPERGRRRDALTVLDESGVWLAGPDATLYTGLAAHRWQEVLWQRREAVRQTLRVAVIGHALLEKALAPYASMTGKCLWLGDAADAEAAACDALIHLTSPRALAPLPVQGLPGWDAANADARFYANADIFRPAPRRLSAAGTTA